MAYKSVLRKAAEKSLEFCLWDNAVFLAERAHAEAPTDESVLLLSTCYYHQGHIRAAYQLLQGSKLIRSKYLLARCCFDLRLFQEGEAILVNALTDPALLQDNDLHAATLCLLGQICKKVGRKTQAIDYFSRSLELTMFMWTALEGLTQLGVDVVPAKYFGELSEASEVVSMSDSQIQTADDKPAVNRRLLEMSPEEDKRSGSSQPMLGLDAMTPSPTAQSSLDLPISNAVDDTVTPLKATVSALFFATPSPAPTTRAALTRAPNPKAHNSTRVVPTNNTPNSSSSSVDLRRSTRLTSSSLDANPRPNNDKLRRRNDTVDTQVAAKRRPQTSRTSTSSVTPLRTSIRTAASQAVQPPKKDKQIVPADSKDSDSNDIVAQPDVSLGQREIIHARTLLSQLALVQIHLQQFRSDKVLEAVGKLSPEQASTSWALCAQGRAYYEAALYEKAETCYAKALQLEPYRVQGLVDIYSTVLWQLRKDVELSFLAHMLEAQAPRSPETWIAVGNCFSLQKEHDAALRCFQRSLQLDPNYAYAYTLSGWEYVAHDDFEKALNCFRNVLRIDSRHYSAWYWLGVIYNRQEKFDLAEFHFRQATHINPSSATVRCYLGMVLASLHRPDEALAELEKAAKLDPRNPLVKFRRAKILVASGQLQDAAAELELTREFAPREAAVYRLLADVYRKLDRTADALRAHIVALDLDPKGTSGGNAMSEELNDDLDQILAAPIVGAATPA